MSKLRFIKIIPLTYGYEIVVETDKLLERHGMSNAEDVVTLVQDELVPIVRDEERIEETLNIKTPPPVEIDSVSVTDELEPVPLFKEGDAVTCERYGIGTVISCIDNDAYPLKVEFICNPTAGNPTSGRTTTLWYGADGDIAGFDYNIRSKNALRIKHTEAVKETASMDEDKETEQYVDLPPYQFQVGDLVTCNLRGNGEVTTDRDSSGGLTYPLEVTFEDDLDDTEVYTRDGKWNVDTGNEYAKSMKLTLLPAPPF